MRGAFGQPDDAALSLARVPGYLGVSDLRDGQVIMLTIKGIHKPSPNVAGAWCELSFKEVKNKVVCNRWRRDKLWEAHRKNWVGKRVYLFKARDVETSVWGLWMIPVKEDIDTFPEIKTYLIRTHRPQTAAGCGPAPPSTSPCYQNVLRIL